MHDAQWRGLLLTPEELAALLSLSGRMVPGLRLPHLTLPNAVDACQGLKRRGLLTIYNGGCLIDPPLRCILDAVVSAERIVRLHGLDGSVSMYCARDMRVILETPAQRRCRLLPLQAAEDAWEELNIFADRCEGHFTLAWSTPDETHQYRPGENWRTILTELRHKIEGPLAKL